jgi:hypothetical protein
MFDAAKESIQTQVDNYNKPTPKKWLLAGVILKSTGKVLAGTALLGIVGPWVGLGALLAGEIIGEIVKFKTETN